MKKWLRRRGLLTETDPKTLRTKRPNGRRSRPAFNPHFSAGEFLRFDEDRIPLDAADERLSGRGKSPTVLRSGRDLQLATAGQLCLRREERQNGERDQELTASVTSLQR